MVIGASVAIMSPIFTDWSEGGEVDGGYKYDAD